MIFGALLGTAATQAAKLATAMIVARALLPEGRGDLQLVVLWPMLAAQIASLSLNEALLVLTASGSGDRRRLFAAGLDRKSTRLNSSHVSESRMPSSA